ncbi:unnamed protein product [Dracunculus medinensis]|uniref:Secreted protein n=1 Tax=Dracunculus medinensis TaxID=318479 RepID=A0A0N4URH6_DRAME|nr:unnamed protein product [Dracunculus medinensis]
MTYFVYLPLLFFISCVGAGDVSIAVCNKPLPPPAPPQVPRVAAPAQEVQYRPTVDPNLCFDLDPACSEVFNLEQPQQTIPDQRNP